MASLATKGEYMSDCRSCKHDLDPEECRICYEKHIVDKLKTENVTEKKSPTREEIMELMNRRSGDSL